MTDESLTTSVTKNSRVLDCDLEVTFLQFVFCMAFAKIIGELFQIPLKSTYSWDRT